MVRTPLSLMNVRARASPRTVFRMSRSCGWSSGRILWLSLFVSKMGVPSVPIEPPYSCHKFIFLLLITQTLVRGETYGMHLCFERYISCSEG